MSFKVCLVSLIHVSLMLCVMSQGDFGGSVPYPRPNNPPYESPSPSPSTYSPSESNVYNTGSPSTFLPPYGSNPLISGHNNDEYKPFSKRDVREQRPPIPVGSFPSTIKPETFNPSTDLPSTTMAFGSFNRHRRDSPTLKPFKPESTFGPDESHTHSSDNRNQREFEETTLKPTFRPDEHSGDSHSHDSGNRNRRDSEETTLRPTFRPDEHSSESHTHAADNRNRRDAEETTLRPTFRPDEHSNESHTHVSDNRNRRDAEETTLRPTFKPDEHSGESHTHSSGNRNRRESEDITLRPSSSTESGERESRLFFTLPTREPSDNNSTTRRFFFNRNRRSTPTKAPERTTSAAVEDFNEQKTTSDEMSTTTKKAEISRFRRNSHEFPPDDDESHTHMPSTTLKSEISTKKDFHSRAQRDSGDDDEFKRRTTSEELPTTSAGSIPMFNMGHSDHQSSDSFFTRPTSTERQPAGFGGRFRRHDDLNSGSFLDQRRTTSADELQSSTKEPSTSTRQSLGHFNF